MNFPGKSIIEQIDQVIADNATAFESGMPTVGSELIDSIAEFLGSLEKNRTGTIKASVANLKAITRFKGKLTTVLQSGEFGTLAADLRGAFLNVTTLTNQYFSLVSDSFSVTDFYKEIRRQNIDTTLSTLLESGMESQFVAPITKVLTQSVTGQMSSKQALQTVREMLSDAGQPTKWAKTYTDDTLNQFSRNYTAAISDDLGLDHYLYSGTVIASTRPFCKSKVGKVFTKAEVEAWAKEDWAGKIKGTNAGNIEIYLGGNKCRHRLVPITAVAYREMKA